MFYVILHVNTKGIKKNIQKKTYLWPLVGLRSGLCSALRQGSTPPGVTASRDAAITAPELQESKTFLIKKTGFTLLNLLLNENNALMKNDLLKRIYTSTFWGIYFFKNGEEKNKPKSILRCII